nr:MAG TPA: hypothetical protein [Caudoviricetes sp.]
MRRPDAARHSGRHLAFQSSLAYRSTLRFSFEAICSPGMPLAALCANAAPISKPACRRLLPDKSTPFAASLTALRTGRATEKPSALILALHFFS